MTDECAPPPRRRRGRPTTLSHAQRRERVLDALDSVYQEGDPANLTMDAVARGAGMSKRTLYDLFEDRDALFDAYFDRLCSAFIRDVPSCRLQESLRVRLTLLLEPRPHAASLLPLAVLRCVIAEAPEHPDVARASYTKFRGQALLLVQAELQRSVERGEIAPLDVTLAAGILLDMVKSNVVDNLVNPDTIPTDADRLCRFQLALDLFLDGLPRLDRRAIGTCPAGAP